MEFKVGEIVMLDNKFECKIVSLFNYEGEEYAEVIPTQFNSFPREVKCSQLKKAVNDEDHNSIIAEDAGGGFLRLRLKGDKIDILRLYSELTRNLINDYTPIVMIAAFNLALNEANKDEK